MTKVYTKGQAKVREIKAKSKDKKADKKSVKHENKPLTHRPFAVLLSK